MSVKSETSEVQLKQTNKQTIDKKNRRTIVNKEQQI
jgi:hypothetical protein